MKTTVKAVLSEVHKKIAVSGNAYYELELTEDVNADKPEENAYLRKWKKLYAPNVKDEEKLKSFMNQEVDVEINLYFQERKVGDNIYQDIRIMVLDINNINKEGNSNTEA